MAYKTQNEDTKLFNINTILGGIQPSFMIQNIPEDSVIWLILSCFNFLVFRIWQPWGVRRIK